MEILKYIFYIIWFAQYISSVCKKYFLLANDIYENNEFLEHWLYLHKPGKKFLELGPKMLLISGLFFCVYFHTFLQFPFFSFFF